MSKPFSVSNPYAWVVFHVLRDVTTGRAHSRGFRGWTGNGDASVCSSEREWKRERNGRLARLIIIIIKYKRSAREAKPDRGGRGAGILSLDLRNTSVDFSHCFLQTRQKPQDRRLVCDSKRLLFISTSFWIKTRSTACVLLARYLAIHRGRSREQPWNPDSCAVSSVSEYEGCSL